MWSKQRGAQMKAKRLTIFSLFILFIAMHFCIAIKAALFVPRPDTSAFYYAANVVMDPQIPNEKAYDNEMLYSISKDYGIDDQPMPFVYSIASAYIMSPIILMSYGTAKVVWNLLNIIMYLGSVIIILQMGKVSKLFLIGSLMLLLFWMPFVYSQIWLQSNALIIFLISLAVLAAVKDRPYTSGCLIGIASLFKIFPLAFALVLGLKNWRIGVTCVLLFIISFLIPGSTNWFFAIKEVHTLGESPFYTPLYILLSPNGSFWFYIYAFIIALVTATLAYCNRAADYLLLISFAIPAAFLVSPLVNYHHLTILALSYAYVLTKIEILPRWFLVAISTSYLFINSMFRLSDNIYFLPAMVGIMLLWGSMVVYLVGISDIKYPDKAKVG
jgi:hypothetical protein